MNNTESISDIFVQKICEKSWSIITKDEILRVWTLSGWSKSRISYAMSILLGRNLVENISKGLYKIVNRESWMVNRESGIGNIDEDYWSIIEKLIAIYSPSGGIIGGEKALELHLQNYSIPDILIIYTRDTAQRVKIKNGREIHFRTLISWEKTGGKNLYRMLLEGSSIFSKNKKLLLLWLEAALLDSLSLRRHETGIEESNILRFLRSFHMKLNREILGTLVRYRYIRAVNRLRVLARDNGYEELYKKTLDVIRDEGGGCYLNI